MLKNSETDGIYLWCVEFFTRIAVTQHAGLHLAFVPEKNVAKLTNTRISGVLWVVGNWVFWDEEPKNRGMRYEV